MRKVVVCFTREEYDFAFSVYVRWHERYASGIPNLMPFNEFCGLAINAALEDMHQMFLADSKNKEEIKNEN